MEIASSCTSVDSVDNESQYGDAATTGHQQCKGTVTHELRNVNMAGKGKVTMKDFELLKVLGTGAYGKVFLVRKVNGFDCGKLYAMKVLKKASIVQKNKTTEHTKTERQVLEAIRQSPFLVTLHYAFQTDAKLHLILDYVNGGEMFTHLFNREHFSESEVQIYIGEIVLALETLHKLGIIYRDIKLENILLDSSGHIVLTDFGLSKEFLPGDTTHRAYSYCGTMEYMAPEVVRGSSAGHDFSVDWWALGVLTYELLTGASPFTVDGERNSSKEISKRILEKHPPIPQHFSPATKSYIISLLHKDPTKRLGYNGAEEIKQHPFFNNLDWDKLAKKEIIAPMLPQIKHELDVSNFSEEFTKMEAADSPAVVPLNGEKMFKGYSYVAPSVIFTDNTVSDDLLQHNSINQPRAKSISAASQFKNSPFFQHYDLDLQNGILGEGSYSVCGRCEHKVTKTKYAVKIISRRVDHTSEVKMLQLCQNHPNIVKLIDVFHDELHTYIVMELLSGGELLNRIQKKKSFTETEASRIMRMLVEAVDYMHQKGVVHRDLKPENILFEDESEGAQAKVVDFGFARLKTENQPLQTPCFTLNFAAPEVLSQATPNNKSRGYDEACDLWSLGVILYTMLSGKAPFQTRNKTETPEGIIKRIKEGEFDFSGQEWHAVSANAKKLIRGLLTVDPRERSTMHNLLQNKWIQGNNDRVFSQTPLHTPGILSSTSNALQQQLVQTMDAFHRAAREGFRLQDVANAPLAQRRQMKRNSMDARSSSNDSTASSPSSSSVSAGSTTMAAVAISPTINQHPIDINFPHTDSSSRNTSNTSTISNISQSSTGFIPTKSIRLQQQQPAIVEDEQTSPQFLMQQKLLDQHSSPYQCSDQFGFPCFSSGSLNTPGSNDATAGRSMLHTSETPKCINTTCTVFTYTDANEIPQKRHLSERESSDSDCIVGSSSIPVDSPPKKRPRTETIVIE
ncbi:ribosomal protein S6 kinase alpha-5 [Octopus bimaculoides]|uniref:non-specific serine/threonine protein kinase n=1 Tax=Octopus bimaculoides TaxID=37653 RepID=A0A0L8HLQ9_OCTBM|nr:ribosomal protein S6 kinase alpha-5 [Octopus bimaculoides]|eukprot:XP_014771299.1 PREDICTED: ribosomal protein S6 kinase alpha-5-like [Octopus bimaculoides]